MIGIDVAIKIPLVAGSGRRLDVVIVIVDFLLPYYGARHWRAWISGFDGKTMPHNLRPMKISRLDPVADRHDVRRALEAGFTGEEVAYMLDLPENTVVEIETDGILKRTPLA